MLLLASIARYHVPVMATEVVEWLVTDLNGLYVDGTFGGGGHSRALLDVLGPRARIKAYDRDPEASANVPDDSRLEFHAGNFEEMSGSAQGVLLDLGVSSHQLDGDRGFSFRTDTPLDMRMGYAGKCASEIISESNIDDLRSILTLGDIYDRRVAFALYQKKPQTTKQLKDAVSHVRDRKILPRIFQALRIAVNDEIGCLERTLSKIQDDVLVPSGRLAVLSYHSHEDRLVKHLFRSGVKDDFGHFSSPWRPLASITPSDDEVLANPRARSARLRVAERTHIKPS